MPMLGLQNMKIVHSKLLKFNIYLFHVPRIFIHKHESTELSVLCKIENFLQMD
jgi:hypothetical protein